MLSAPRLDPGHGEPLYKQLLDAIKGQIINGLIADNERLPATRELAARLGVNRATVAAAYEQLEKEGLLRAQVGRGSFVRRPVEALPFSWEGRVMEPAAAQAGSREGVISFASSRPDSALFPYKAVSECVRAVVESTEAAAVLQLGSPLGYQPLRDYLLGEGARNGEANGAASVLITSGCQQALDLLQRVLVRAGDRVLVEDPVYPGLREVFLRAGARLAGVPVGPHGMDVAALEAEIRREAPRLIVVTPSFQNPTGATMPVESRRALLAVAHGARIPIVENAIYAPLRYMGESLPSLKRLDESGAVIQMQSFSKSAFPGLRVGWIVAARPLVAALTEAKQWADLHTDQLSQAVMLRFASSGALEAHLRNAKETGGQRLRACLEACERHLPEGTRFTRPEGGMSLWVTLPDGIDASQLLVRAESEGVEYLPGPVFGVGRTHASSLRLSYSGLAPAAIERGLRILARCAMEARERVRQTNPAPALV